MKKVFGLIALVSFALFSYNNIKKTDSLVDTNGIPDYTEVGSGNNTESTVDTEEVQNDEPVQHSQEAIDYFNTICRGSEYGSGNQISLKSIGRMYLHRQWVNGPPRKRRHPDSGNKRPPSYLNVQLECSVVECIPYLPLQNTNRAY